MGEVASSTGLQAVVGAIARTSDADFDLRRTLKALGEVAMAFSGARGVTIEQARDGSPGTLLVLGDTSGSPRRLPIISEGVELGFLTLHGVTMFGPATADRTQVLADLAGAAIRRADHIARRAGPAVDDERYRLINGVGHNLRNTLGAATGYTQLVEMEGPLNETQQEFVTRSRRAINAAVSLITDLIELTRADAGKLTFDREAVNVNAIAREAIRKHNDEAAAKHCEIEFSSLVNPVVVTDASYVQQILDVLVYNAVRYTRPSRKIKVAVDMRTGRRTSDPPSWVCVAVTDAGVGVPDAEKVFEEVFRVEQAHGNVRFRLAICRRIARLLGGDLMLETQKDVGSTFTLWLPLPSAE
jgi:signal transduction histidine kinase